MQAVILAGGLGTRLGTRTTACPKAMIPVLGKPFLEYQLALLHAHEVRDVVLCIGHYGEQIEDYFGDGARFGMRIQYSRDGDRLLGTGGAVKKAEALLDDTFMLTWGDSYLQINYQDVWRFHIASALPATMTVYQNRQQGEVSNVMLDGDRVAEYDKWHPRPEMVYVDYGLSVFSRSVLERIPAGEVFAVEELFRQFAQERRLAAYEARDRFYEIGSESGLADFTALMAQQITR